MFSSRFKSVPLQAFFEDADALRSRVGVSEELRSTEERLCSICFTELGRSVMTCKARGRHELDSNLILLYI